eukprot:scaffold7945_cov119-Isochrysis_galbana.AAC.3
MVSIELLSRCTARCKKAVNFCWSWMSGTTLSSARWSARSTWSSHTSTRPGGKNIPECLGSDGYIHKATFSMSAIVRVPQFLYNSLCVTSRKPGQWSLWHGSRGRWCNATSASAVPLLYANPFGGGLSQRPDERTDRICGHALHATHSAEESISASCKGLQRVYHCVLRAEHQGSHATLEITAVPIRASSAACSDHAREKRSRRILTR